MAQHAVLQALRRKPSPQGGLRGWLATVARRAAWRMGRDDARRSVRERAAARNEQVDPTSMVVEREAAIRRLMDAVFALDEPYRSTIVMRFYEDLAPADIAERLGVPAATVRTRLHRALAQLRERLDAESGPDGWRRALMPFAFGPLWQRVLEGAGSATSTVVTSTVTAQSAAGLGVLLMTKKILAVCLVAALAGVTWFILDDTDQSGDGQVETGTGTHIVAGESGGALPEAGRVNTDQRGPIGTARFRDTTTANKDGSEQGPGPRATLTGRVVDESGIAVANAGVLLKLSKQDPVAAPGDDSRQELGDLDVRTDPDGRFTFTHVPVGYEGRIRVRPAKLCDVKRDLEIDSARTFDVGDMVARTGGSIAGRVLTPTDVDVTDVTVTAWRQTKGSSGRPGVMVVVRPELTDGRSIRPGSDGSYRIDGLAEGEWILGIELAGFPRKLPRHAQVTRGDVTWDVDLAVSDAGRIVGQVLDQQGRVLAGARVGFRIDDGSLESMVDRRETASATTAGDGRFVLRGLDAEAGRLRVAKDGFRTWSRPSIAPDGEELVIKLTPTGVLYGVVTAKTGDDPGQIEVIPSVADQLGAGARRNMRVVYGEEAAAAAGVADAPGLYAVLETPADPIRLRIRAPGFAEKVVSPIVVASGAVQQHDVSLLREVVIAGVVVDPDGNPVADARVNVSRPSSRRGGPGGGFGRRRVERRVVRREAGEPNEVVESPADGNVATSDAEGRFEVKGLGSGTWELRASHADHADSTTETVDLGSNAPGSIRLTLRSSGSLAGTVIARDGTPKAGARVVVSEASSGPEIPIPVTVISDNDGRFERKGLVPGAYKARLHTAYEEGRVMVFETDTAAEDPSTVRFEIKEGQTTTITVTEPELGVLTGVVRASGSPVSEARVSLRAEGSPSLMTGASVACDAQGAFRFDDVVPGSYVIHVNPPGAARPITRAVTVAAKPPVHEIIDLPTGGIEGRVLDQDGNPVAGLTIGVVPTRDDGGPPPRRGIMVMVTDTGDGPTTTVRTVGGDDGIKPVRTDGDGRYSVRFLNPDTYNVSVSGGGWIPQKVESVEVKEALVTRRIDMQTSKGGALLVTAKAPDGSAPQVVIGRLARPGEEENPFKTEAGPGDKPLRFDGLAPGRYIVTISVPGGELPGGGQKGTSEIDVQAGVELPLEVKLKREL